MNMREHIKAILKLSNKAMPTIQIAEALDKRGVIRLSPSARTYPGHPQVMEVAEIIKDMGLKGELTELFREAEDERRKD